jgi:acetyl esterase/lipase
LVERLKIPPKSIVIAGDSAGGGLALALLLYLRDNGYPLPSCAILMCPWVGELHFHYFRSNPVLIVNLKDLTMSCDSWVSNAHFDVVPIPAPDDHLNPVVLYLGDNMEKYLTHPYASPLFGEFKGLPPLLIQAGEAEVLRDEITLLAHKASSAGVEVRLELYEDAVRPPFIDRSFEF